MKALALASLLLGFVACGGPGNGGNNGSEQSNGACPSSPDSLVGTVPAGGACMTADDCQPTCCSCDTGSNQWLGASCVGKKCADAATACNNTKHDDLYCQ